MEIALEAWVQVEEVVEGPPSDGSCCLVERAHCFVASLPELAPRLEHLDSELEVEERPVPRLLADSRGRLQERDFRMGLLQVFFGKVD